MVGRSIAKKEDHITKVLDNENSSVFIYGFVVYSLHVMLTS